MHKDKATIHIKKNNNKGEIYKKKKKDLQIITIKGTSQPNSFSYKVTHYKERKGLVVARHNPSTRKLQQGDLEFTRLLI